MPAIRLRAASHQNCGVADISCALNAKCFTCKVFGSQYNSFVVRLLSWTFQICTSVFCTGLRQCSVLWGEKHKDTLLYIQLTSSLRREISVFRQGNKNTLSNGRLEFDVQQWSTKIARYRINTNRAPSQIGPVGRVRSDNARRWRIDLDTTLPSNFCNVPACWPCENCSAGVMTR